MKPPAPTERMLRCPAEKGAHRQDQIIGWFPDEAEQAAAAFSLAVEANVIVRVFGKDDADVHARWGLSAELAIKAAEQTARSSN